MRENNSRTQQNAELVSTGARLTFTQQDSGRLVAFWGQGRDRMRVLVDSIKFAVCVSPGDTLEVDIYEVPTKRGYLLTARPSQSLRQALSSRWSIGDLKLKLCFRPKADDTGVYAIEPLTGKRVYPEDGVRVWVNGYYEYLVREVDRHLIAYPILEPAEKRRDRENPDEPYTYKQKRPQQRNYRHGGGQDGRRNQRNRNQRGPRREAKPVRCLVTFQPKDKGEGIIAFDEQRFGRRPILPEWGQSFLLGAPMECDLMSRGRIVVARPVKSVQELAAEVTDEITIYTAPARPDNKGEAKPAAVQPQSPVEKFNERAAKKATVTCADKVGGDKQATSESKPPKPLTFAEKLAAATGQTSGE